MPTFRTTCKIGACEPHCGLEIEVGDGRMTAARPDPQHSITPLRVHQGHARERLPERSGSIAASRPTRDRGLGAYFLGGGDGGDRSEA